MVDSGFADRLALAMREKGVTQTQFGQAVGVSPSTVSRWLAGSVPRKLVAAGIAQYLNVNIEWLREGMGDKFYFSVLARDGVTVKELLKLPTLDSQAKEKIADQILSARQGGIGFRISFLRRRLGLSMREFARRCGCTVGYLSRLEGGSRSNPSPKFQDALMLAFSVHQKWIMWGDPPILIRSRTGESQGDKRTVRILEDLEKEEVEKAIIDRQRSVDSLVKMPGLSNKDLVEIIETVKASSRLGRNWASEITVQLLTDALLKRLANEPENGLP